MSITPNSKLAMTLGTALTCAALIGGTAWRVANMLRDVRDELAAIRRDVNTVAQDQWTQRDQERWAFELERSNRERQMIVPSVRGVRGERGLP